MVSVSMTPPRMPVATYRLQFNRNLTFAQATDLVPYLAALGISHCYASPYLRARPGSTHGYDIIDHNSLNPEIGTAEDYDRFVAALHHHGMGQILDIVPNHMGVMGSDNAWWLDVLENGEASVFADFFDIDWEPLKDELQGKVLVPVLGDQYGTILDRGELKLTFDRERGEFSISYYQHRFPINPREYPRILSRGINRLEQAMGSDNIDLLELQSLTAAFGHLPSRKESSPEQRGERQRDKEINKRRLAALCARSDEIATFLNENTNAMNGIPGDPSSFDELHELIKAQAYRLAYWRVAADDINYRRFFDVNDLAALRQENNTVFEATHRYIFQLLKEAKIDGVRVDHPDGLYDPAEYFRRFQNVAATQATGAESKPVYVLAEKILSGSERLPPEWPVDGTTGYDFVNLVNALFVDASSEMRMERIYRGFVRDNTEFHEIVYASKKTVMHGALTSELNVLASSLSRIALANRHTCDFTLNSLRDAISEVAACFPVYRTYVTATQISASDRNYIDQAVECAKRRSTAGDTTVFDFIRAVLLTRQSHGRPDFYRRSVIDFAMKFQQFTSALMAKGSEDTSFYRYHRLTSLNEVGGDPCRFGISVADFHRANCERLRDWPHTMLATSTHDTKRSEDVRCRIDVLSELPLLWRKNVRRWRDLNAAKKRCVEGEQAPHPNDEYLLYQTLIGAWPLEQEQATEDFSRRMREYMLKAVREAKEKTSWANQKQAYEEAVTSFVAAVLDASGSNDFLASFLPFQRLVARFGMLNSLSQTLLKLASPGVPDTYQGTEFWDFSLVDPDNRRLVNYRDRIAALRELQNPKLNSEAHIREHVSGLVRNMHDGRIKQYVIWKALAFRNQNRALFEKGSYRPLTVEGSSADHVVAFSREYRKGAVVVIAPRLYAGLQGIDQSFPLGPGVWKDTRIVLPAEYGNLRLANLFTGERIQPDHSNLIALSGVLTNFPVALLTRSEIAREHGSGRSA
jgi:(1->4)-alpha-D-glucan 1-alpha-D-glucosylmutase